MRYIPSAKEMQDAFVFSLQPARAYLSILKRWLQWLDDESIDVPTTADMDRYIASSFKDRQARNRARSVIRRVEDACRAVRLAVLVYAEEVHFQADFFISDFQIRERASGNGGTRASMLDLAADLCGMPKSGAGPVIGRIVTPKTLTKFRARTFAQGGDTHADI